MSGGQEERKRILVLTYIETFSTGNAVTPVYLEMFSVGSSLFLNPQVFSSAGSVRLAKPIKSTPSILRKSAVKVCVFSPPEMPMPKFPPPISSLETMSIVAPPTSLLPPALKALLTPTDCMTSVPKSRERYSYIQGLRKEGRSR